MKKARPGGYEGILEESTMSNLLTCDSCTDKGHCHEYKAGAVCVIERKKNSEGK